jgi:FAD:protein FMN transferase
MSGEVLFRHAEQVMGTVVSFDVRPGALRYEQTQRAIAQACRVLHRADEIFSLYRAESPLSRLRSGELSLLDCPVEVAEVLALCEQARQRSNGWFDPWALPGGLDPTGLVKGWAAQQAADTLGKAGVDGAMVNAAGDIAMFGAPLPTQSWRIGVRSPDRPDRLLCVVAGAPAVATSGSYERGAHIRDVIRGREASAAVSATVCGEDLAFADAFATGLVAAGEEGLPALRRAGYEALLVLPGGEEVHTPGFPFARDQEPAPGVGTRT